ncbi:hypothetical protein [Gordonia sp. (in: high G+C Gram-positive bacteria)]|uniref:hypothetical protein n=1 Tax=Gordonia sp. (in: high G+C Gram-positive bacteria) TaxID=84139 RepID=UPI0039E2ADE4
MIPHDVLPSVPGSGGGGSWGDPQRPEEPKPQPADGGGGGSWGDTSPTTSNSPSLSGEGTVGVKIKVAKPTSLGEDGGTLTRQPDGSWQSGPAPESDDSPKVKTNIKIAEVPIHDHSAYRPLDVRRTQTAGPVKLEQEANVGVGNTSAKATLSYENGLHGELSAEASAVKISGKQKTTIGPVKSESSAELEAFQVGVKGKLGAEDGNLKGSLEAEANVVKTKVTNSLDVGPANIKQEVEAKVGANSSAKGSIGKDGADLELEAFAGAEVTGKLHADVGGVGADAGGALRAGIGANAKATIGKTDDGKFQIGAKLGATLGIGAEVNFNVTIDPKKVTDTAKSAAEGAKKVGSAAVNVTKKAVSKLKFW